jgi:hypothetical protein
LIEVFGVPAYCKIDVEGHEFEVLSGLSIPIPALSIEVVPELIENALSCIERLESLGDYRYSYSPDESLSFAWKDLDRSDADRRLRALRAPLDFGDLFARISHRPA